MYPHKFGKEIDIKLDNNLLKQILEKIKDNPDNEVLKEVLEKVNENFRIEQKLIDDISRHKRFINSRLRNLHREIENSFSKESFTIILDKTLTKVFNQPIRCEDCEIALVDLQAERLLNINESNRVVESFEDGKWKIYKVTPDCINFDEIRGTTLMPYSFNDEITDFYEMLLFKLLKPISPGENSITPHF